MTFDAEKHTTIADQYKSGRAVRDIAEDMGVTRQRIYQILHRQGITGKHGGQAVRSAIKRSTKSRERRSRHLEVYGCTEEQLKRISAIRSDKSGSPLVAFRNQRNNARCRGVSWELKFWDWWLIWQDSGRWSERGREQGSYCMCRKGDEGPYAPGNVYIATVDHNTSFGRALACERGREPSPFMRLMRAAGGRKAVSEVLGVPRSYLSQLANNGFMPASWLADGRAQSVVQMTLGTYSMEDAMRIAVKPAETKFPGEAA